MQYVHELPRQIKLTVTSFIITLGRSVTLVDLRIVLSTPFGPFSSRDDGCGGVHQETILSVGQDSSVVLQITMCFDSFIISSHCLSIYPYPQVYYDDWYLRPHHHRDNRDPYTPPFEYVLLHTIHVVVHGTGAELCCGGATTAGIEGRCFVEFCAVYVAHCVVRL